MSKIAELWSRQLSGTLSKHEYIDACFGEVHEPLLQLRDWLRTTAIRAVEIGDDGVCYVSRIAGTRFFVPLGDRRSAPVEAVNFHAYEAAEFAQCVRFLRDGDVVLDIGANIGWYSLHWAALFPRATVHAFEPVPTTFGLLERNRLINQAGNLILHHLALSDHEGIVDFFVDPAMTVSASMQNLSGKTDALSLRVMAKTLDAVVVEQGIAPVDFIKCDVEGAEYLALRGGEATLRTHRPTVFAEMLRKWSARFGYHPNELIDWMAALGYTCYAVTADGLAEFAFMDDQVVETNFLFVHRDRRSSYGL